jgi:hypothetical protein
MGMYYYFQVGAYYLCRNTLVEVEKTYNSCPMPNCRQHKTVLKSRFCQECGCSIAPLTKTTRTRKVDPNQVLEVLTEVLWTPRMHIDFGNKEQDIWTANIGSDGTDLGTRSYETKGESFIHEIDSAKIASDLQNFTTAFAEEKQILEQFYGAENVSTVWGVFNYYV